MQTSDLQWSLHSPSWGYTALSPLTLQPDLQTSLILGSFWQKLGFYRGLKPMNHCCYTALKCLLEQGWTEVHTHIFFCRCFLKSTSLEGVLPVLLLSRPLFHTLLSQIVSLRWHSSSSRACSGLPASSLVPLGRKRDPMWNEPGFLPWALNYWNCKHCTSHYS